MTGKKPINSGMKAGYKYTKHKLWYNNGKVETQIFEGNPIPHGFTRGRLKTNKPAWNTGLTKDTDPRVKKISDSCKQRYHNRAKLSKSAKQITDEYLINTFILPNIFEPYYITHTVTECCRYFKISKEVLIRIIKLGNYMELDQHKIALYNKTYTEEWRKAHSLKLKGKNTWSKGRKATELTKQHMHEAQQKISATVRLAAKEKEVSTRKKNGSYKNHITKAEGLAYNILLKYFSKTDIEYLYFDKERYPFACDFYIRSKDLFIEINQYPSHGGRAFKNTADDMTQLNKWRQKINEGKLQYQNWIYTWTDLDVRKLLTATNNKLNYLAIYDITTLEEKLYEYLYNKID